MSDVIQLLPDSVANQIAAGEVIQRPASVIKELVENSIDAGATQVKIFLRDAGKTLIQVVDDGCGMSDTDARLAFERHATSKIRQASDLFELHTMGFRGEALPSIAAVAQIDLFTMKHDATLGTHLELAASKFVSQVPEACAPGSNLSVKNLFFNFPARRKFLKKDAVELSHILHEFERLALVNPGVEFELCHNDVTLHQLLPGSLRMRISGLFGRAIDKQLIPVETETPLVKISGFISLPEHARKRNALQYFFVNGRNMVHPYFRKAVLSCYEQLISSDHQPNFFINFEVEPQTIDVNIHPTKSEIKFENEQAIWQILSAAVREALGKFNASPALDFSDDAPEIPVFNPDAGAAPELNIDVDYNPFAPTKRSSEAHTEDGGASVQTAAPSRLNSGYSGSSRRSSLDNWEKLYADFKSATAPETGVPGADTAAPTPESFLTDETDLPASIEASALNAIPGMDISWQNVGGVLQLANRFLVTAGVNSLIVIDRHRAHVKVLYERFLKETEQSVGKSQQVMFGQVVELTPEQRAVLDSVNDEVKALGYEFSLEKADGEGMFQCEISGVPAILGNADPAQSLLKIIDDAASETGNSRESIHRRLALSLAQSAAIRANEVQLPAEAERLLADLFSLPDPTYSPEGSTIICQIPLSEIARRF